LGCKFGFEFQFFDYKDGFCGYLNDEFPKSVDALYNWIII